MKINSVSNEVSFKNLYNKINPSDLKTEALRKEYSKILKFISINNLDKKRYADIVLEYDKKDLFYGGFYGVISDKKGNVPRNCYRMHISSKRKDKNNFVSWLNDWNKAFNPKLKESYWRTSRYVNLVITEKIPIKTAMTIIDKEAKSKPWLKPDKFNLSV